MKAVFFLLMLLLLYSCQKMAVVKQPEGVSLLSSESNTSSNKFPPLTDSALLNLVQLKTFDYFWDYGNPVSGLARERSNGLFNTSDSVSAIGGSGFGIMAILVGVERHFVTKQEGLERITKIVNFLSNKTITYHGAFAHWVNGYTGKTIPFSTEDDGADLVETSYLMEGLLCARQYFNNNCSEERSLVKSINILWNNVDWDWFRKDGKNVLFWHWSPDYKWEGNFKIQGWNEALITYVLAASSNSHSIPSRVYVNGWAQNGSIVNGKKYFGVTLPLGEKEGGPLFFTHYTFMGLDPQGLRDQYADYWQQDTAHATINYSYCVTNPKHNAGYSDSCWGLTASDIQNGYTASSPTNDVGVIAPTAAISSLPYTPQQSMKAIRFFYYNLGNKLWGKYGFLDAFDVSTGWYDDGYLAIDEGPEINMIENYRSGLLWHLFMSCPEVKSGLRKLGFRSPLI